MKKPIAFIAFAVLLALVGCGHNISVYSKGVGVELAWRPNRFHIACAVIVLILAMSFVMVHLLQKRRDMKKMVEDNRETSGR